MWQFAKRGRGLALCMVELDRGSSSSRARDLLSYKWTLQFGCTIMSLNKRTFCISFLDQNGLYIFGTGVHVGFLRKREKPGVYFDFLEEHEKLGCHKQQNEVSIRATVVVPIAHLLSQQKTTVVGFCS